MLTQEHTKVTTKEDNQASENDENKRREKEIVTYGVTTNATEFDPIQIQQLWTKHPFHKPFYNSSSKTGEQELQQHQGQKHLDIKPSLIDNAGMGLFSAVFIPCGELIGYYTGALLTTTKMLRTVLNNEAQSGSTVRRREYLMRAGYCHDLRGIVWIDAYGYDHDVNEDIEVKPRAMANETNALGEEEENDDLQIELDHNAIGIDIVAKYQKVGITSLINDCRNVLGYNTYFKRDAAFARVEVRTLRDVAAGEELYIDYGSWYWRGRGSEPQRLDAIFLGQSYLRIMAATTTATSPGGKEKGKGVREITLKTTKTGTHLSMREIAEKYPDVELCVRAAKRQNLERKEG